MYNRRKTRLFIIVPASSIVEIGGIMELRMENDFARLYIQTGAMALPCGSAIRNHFHPGCAPHYFRRVRNIFRQWYTIKRKFTVRLRKSRTVRNINCRTVRFFFILTIYSSVTFSDNGTGLRAQIRYVRGNLHEIRYVISSCRTTREHGTELLQLSYHWAWQGTVPYGTLQ